MNITIDQQYYFPHEAPNVEKEQSQVYGPDQAEPDNHSSNPDPFLLTDSKIMTGQGKAIICAVGDSTLLSRLRQGEDLEIVETCTHLESKL